LVREEKSKTEKKKLSSVPGNEQAAGCKRKLGPTRRRGTKSTNPTCGKKQKKIRIQRGSRKGKYQFKKQGEPNLRKLLKRFKGPGL